MLDLMTTLTTLRRPRLLVRGAKSGAVNYKRDKHLQRIFGYGSLPESGFALMRLMDMEREIDDQRRNNDGGYSLARHLEILIALIGEAQLFQASRASQIT